MRTAAKRLAIITAAVGFSMAAACPANAASGGGAHPTRSAWFFTTAADQAGAPVEAPVTQPTGVPQGDDPVAYIADQSGASSEETVLQFSLPRVADASTVTDFTISMSLDSSPSAPQAAATGAPIVACLPTRGWSPGEAQDSSGQPTVDCSHAVAGVWKGNTVQFAIAKLAQSWVDDVNLGVALVNDPKNKTQPFQAVFRGGTAIAATLRFTPGSTGTTSGSTHHHPQQPHQPTGQSGSQHHASVPPSTGGTTTPSIPNLGTPTTGSTTTQTNDQAAQPPVVATTTPGSAAQATASQSAPNSSSLPPKGFWVAGAGLMILLAGAALALDDHRATSPTRSNGTQLDRLLRDPTRLATFTTRSQP